MNRLAKLTCWLTIAEMAAVAIAAFAARWPDIVHHHAAISFFGWRLIFALWFFPAWLAAGLALTEHKLRPKGMQLSDDHRRIAEMGMVASCLMGAGMQGWFAAIFAFRNPALLHISPQAVGMIVGGAFFLVYGNASAKLGPPIGPAAPDPGAWIRANLRSGWVTVLLGVMMIASAFAPPIARFATMMALVPGSVAYLLWQRRVMRRGPPPQAPA
jgi:hypothetical protein